MALLYKPTKYAFVTVLEDGDKITEQEHTDSCDINKMIRSIDRGQMVRGGGSTIYGYDDTNMDAVQHRILKQQAEEELKAGPKEFTQEILDLIPASIKQKFGFKLAPKTDESKTNEKAPNPAEIPNPASGIPSPSNPSLKADNAQ